MVLVLHLTGSKLSPVELGKIWAFSRLVGFLLYAQVFLRCPLHGLQDGGEELEERFLVGKLGTQYLLRSFQQRCFLECLSTCNSSACHSPCPLKEQNYYHQNSSKYDVGLHRSVFKFITWRKFLALYDGAWSLGLVF